MFSMGLLVLVLMCLVMVMVMWWGCLPWRRSMVSVVSSVLGVDLWVAEAGVSESSSLARLVRSLMARCVKGPLFEAVTEGGGFSLSQQI